MLGFLPQCPAAWHCITQDRSKWKNNRDEARDQCPMGSNEHLADRDPLALAPWASPITDLWASPPRKAGDHRSFGKAGGHDRLLTPRRCSSRPTMCQKKVAFKSVETLKAMRGS